MAKNNTNSVVRTKAGATLNRGKTLVSDNIKRRMIAQKKAKQVSKPK